MTEMYGDTFLFLDEGESEVTSSVYSGEDVLLFTFQPETTAIELDSPELLQLVETGIAGGGSASSFIHTQASPAATWIIDHNLGRPVEPVVLLDANPTKQVWTDVEHGTYNQTTLTFPSPVSGKAIF